MSRLHLHQIQGTALLLLMTSAVLFGQVREYRIHDRGMLHETVYNTGEIGRAWMTGSAGNETSLPVFEWPSRSATIVDGQAYSGQHNILGAGMYIGANEDGSPGVENRLHSLCGGVGASDPEIAFLQWSFPLYMEEIENFPLLEDGSLNPDYDPDEAEEIIRAGWASSVGITVHRTSRAWSYPDYDDMIIYEYELIYTGDTDGNPETTERTTDLKDVMITFIYGFAPSMYGYQRTYNEWKYAGGIYRGDQNGLWDADYWLAYNLNLRTGSDEQMGKPEPDLDHFYEFSESGLNGGGLASPQAPGYCMLYYDTNHLARIDPNNPSLNESEVVNILRTTTTDSATYGYYYELDENLHLKQPYSNKISTGNTRSEKMTQEAYNPTKRWSGVYAPGSQTWPNPPEDRWIGRAAYPYRQSADAGQKHTVFGPYTLHLGDTLRYALAEVVGYGGESGKMVEGGQTLVQWAATPDWDMPVTVEDSLVTEHYLTDYGYPDYVNSDSVINVMQVAHKAFEAYLGHSIAYNESRREPEDGPMWPEDNPAQGSYTIPVNFPAPVVNIEATSLAEARLTWTRDLEAFDHPRLKGMLDHFVIWRSVAGMGPWDSLGVLAIGEVNGDGLYEFLDTDPNFKVGEYRYYSVTSVDEHGEHSGRTNIQRFVKTIGAIEEADLSEIAVVPNPFYIESGYTGGGESVNKLGFYRLPPACTIRIFSYAGQLVKTIEHDDPVYSTEWFQVSRNEQEIASGLYFFVVTTPSGRSTSGKFIVVK